MRKPQLHQFLFGQKVRTRHSRSLREREAIVTGFQSISLSVFQFGAVRYQLSAFGYADQ